jgi:alpha-glucosidase
MPNLNLNNPLVQDTMLEVSRFWFDLGVDGFRLDAVTHYACDEQLRDNPLYANGVQMRLYDIDSPNGALFINRLKDLCDSYDTPKTLLAEYSYDKSPEGFTKACEIFKTSRCNAFFTGALNEHLGKFKQNIADDLKVSSKGEKLNWAFSNHDLERAASRVFGAGVTPAKTKMLISLLLTLPGSICIYQGEELGLPNPQSIDKCKNKANDPLGVWTDYGNPWDAGRAGFAMSDSRDDPSRKLALHPAAIHYRQAVSRQKDEDSVLNFTRQMIQKRKHSIFNEYGHVYFLEYRGDEVYPYLRTNQDESKKVLCLYNFSSYGAEVWYNGKRYYLEPESWQHHNV